ncbi:MAG: phage protein Gp27 family protein [Candidatus Binatus sp.]|jgi:hypothetical protein
MPRRNKIDLLPMKQREAIEKFVADRGFGNYKEMSAAVEKKFGVALSRSALARFGSRLENRLQLLRVAAATARAIVAELGPEDGAAIGAGMISVAQSHVFEALADATAAQLGTPDLATLGSLAAKLERIRIAEARRADKAEERIARAAAIVAPGAGGDAEGPPDTRAASGLSREKTDQLREALTGSAPN